MQAEEEASHALRCTCGGLAGSVRRSRPVNRVICYCADCQAFARFLGREHEVMDEAGGTDIVHVPQSCITFAAGTDRLACMRLTSRGLLRWYAACCKTPIGNTHPNCRIPVIGLVHSCLADRREALDGVFGPVRMRVFTRFAVGELKPRPRGLLAGACRLSVMVVASWLTGGHRRTPLFVSRSCQPVVAPRVLTPDERDALGRHE